MINRFQLVNPGVNFFQAVGVFGAKIGAFGLAGNVLQAFFIQSRGALQVYAEKGINERIVGADSDGVDFDIFVPGQFDCLRQRQGAAVVFAVGQQDDDFLSGGAVVAQGFER